MTGLERLRCPWCHDDMREDDEVSACRGCLAAHHAPCWDEQGRCATCGRARALTETAPRGVGGPWRPVIRTLAGAVACYVLSGPLAGVLGLVAEGSGSRAVARTLYTWFGLCCLVVLVGVLTAVALWVIVRCGQVALGRPVLWPTPTLRRPTRARAAARRRVVADAKVEPSASDTDEPIEPAAPSFATTRYTRARL